jgi:hypothetical protein
MIHIFGDSHSYNGFDNISTLDIHYIGSVLCYSFGEEKTKRLNIKDYNVKNGDVVIFCFGEIDCRCHIHKRVTPEKSYTNIIDAIIDNYFEAIKENISSYTDIKVYVYNVVPPVEKHNTEENPNHPFLGSDDERKKYVLYFNTKLKEKCLNFDFNFFDVYNKYVNKNGFLNKEFSDNVVHIKNGIFIQEFIEKNISQDKD